MDIALWTIQIILVFIFATAGLVKLTLPSDRLVKMATWTNRFSVPTVRLIGMAELSGAAGLIFPQVINIDSVFSTIAAGGLVLVMILAFVHHINHREYKPVIITLTLMALTAFVAYAMIEIR